MERVQVVDGKLELPKSVLRWIAGADELVIAVQSDSVVIKKIHPRRLSEFARSDRTQPPMPMSEIVSEVKKVRRNKKRARRS